MESEANFSVPSPWIRPWNEVELGTQGHLECGWIGKHKEKYRCTGRKKNIYIYTQVNERLYQLLTMNMSHSRGHR